MSTNIHAALSRVTAMSVAVSDIYAEKCNIRRDDDWYILKLQEEVGELTQAWLKSSGRGRTNGASQEDLRGALGDEFADVLAPVLLIADHLDFDLVEILARKWFGYLPPDHPLRAST